MADRERRVLTMDTTNGRSGDGVVVIGGEDGEGLNMDRCGYVTPHHEL